jgi:hypothetical protein
MSTDLNAIKEKTGGIVLVDGKERKIHIYDLNGEPTGTKAFRKEESYDRVVKDVSETHLELYRFDPEPRKLLAVLTPEGVVPDEKLLDHVVEILEKHGLKPNAHSSDVRGFLGFPLSPSQSHEKQLASSAEGFLTTAPRTPELRLRAPTAVTEETDRARKELEIELEEIDRDMQLLAVDIVELEGDDKRAGGRGLKYSAFLGYNRKKNTVINKLVYLDMMDRLEEKGDEEKLKTIKDLMNNMPEWLRIRIFERPAIIANPDDPETFIATLRRITATQ